MRVLSENSGFRNPENPLKVLQTMLGGGDAPLAGMFGGNSPLQGMTSQLLEGLQVSFNSFFLFRCLVTTVDVYLDLVFSKRRCRAEHFLRLQRSLSQLKLCQV